MRAPPSKAPAATVQEELPFSSIQPHVLFPGRTSLYPHEVAHALSISTRQVIDLCAEGTLAGAINIAGEKNTRAARFWRIPVSAYDAYLRRRSNVSETFP